MISAEHAVVGDAQWGLTISTGGHLHTAEGPWAPVQFLPELGKGKVDTVDLKVGRAVSYPDRSAQWSQQ